VRPSNREPDALRPVTIETGVNRYAEGSCLIAFGHTRVLVTASVDESVPPFLRGRGQGWVTAEYGMLPRATHTRGRREAAEGKQSGRSQEIQRLIGRSLRAVTDMKALGERQISIDCDVIQADGGTRTAAITGGWVALRIATRYLLSEGVIAADPILDQVAAISCGVHQNTPVLDLDYEEDSQAEADANFVLTGAGAIVEIQATGERRGFSTAEFETLFALARKGIGELIELQKAAV
jgi:ribonuclease PH